MFKKFWTRITLFDTFIIVTSFLLLIIVLNLPFGAKKFGDGEYYGEARIISEAIRGERPVNEIIISEGPTTDLYYTIPYIFIPKSAEPDTFWIVSVIWNFIFSTIGLLLLKRAGTNIFSEEIGKLSVILSLLFPLHLYYGAGVLAEGPAFFFIILAIYSWSKWRLTNYNKTFTDKNWWVLFLSLLIFLTMRPNGIFVIGIFILIAIIANFINKEKYNNLIKSLFKTSAITIFAFLLIALFTSKFSVSNYKAQEDQLDLLAYGFFNGKFMFREEPLDWRFFNKEYRHGSVDYKNWVTTKDSLENIVINENKSYKLVFLEWGLKDTWQNPFLFIRTNFIKVIHSHILLVGSVSPDKMKIGPFSPPIGFYIFHIALNLFNAIILAFSIYTLIKFRKKLIETVYLWGPWIALILFLFISTSEQRYLFPARPIINLLGAAGIYMVFKEGVEIKKRLYPTKIFTE